MMSDYVIRRGTPAPQPRALPTCQERMHLPIRAPAGDVARGKGRPLASSLLVHARQQSRGGGMSSAAFNYVATAHKPTNVIHSLVTCFTGPDTLNLVVSRCTRIEIYALQSSGLTLIADVPLWCRIATMEVWKPEGRRTDRLFISTEGRWMPSNR